MKKIALICASLLAVLTLSSCGDNNDEFNSWTSDCLQAGGVVSLVHKNWLYDRYECVIDGEIVTLPGWEGY